MLYDYEKKLIENECLFHATKSRGPGGQHVNKTESAAILEWSPHLTVIFSDERKQRLIQNLSSRLNRDGFLQIRSDEFRSLDSNKKRSLLKLLSIIEEALHIAKPRKKTKPTRSSQRKRIEEKRHRSEIKKLRTHRHQDD
jgi:ribosome-associated protein